MKFSEQVLSKDRFTCKPVGNRGVDERSGSGGEKQGRTWKKCGTFKNGLFFKNFKLRESRIIDKRQNMIINYYKDTLSVVTFISTTRRTDMILTNSLKILYFCSASAGAQAWVDMLVRCGSDNRSETKTSRLSVTYTNALVDGTRVVILRPCVGV